MTAEHLTAAHLTAEHLTVERMRLLSPTAEQRELAASAASMFARFRPDGDARRTVDVLDCWPVLAQTALLGAAVPEASGGLGLSAPDLVLLTEEAGRALVPGPVVETIWIAAPALAALGEPWSPVLASTLSGASRCTAVDATLRGPDLDVASYVVVPGPADDLLFNGDAVGAVAPVPTQDRRERSFRLTSPPVGNAAGHVLPPVNGLRAIDRGRLGAAAYLLGVARGLVERSVSYAAVREQFGHSIGSFQAVRHRLADAHVEVEFARSAVWSAACQMPGRNADADPDAELAIMCASAAAKRAFAEVDRHCLQVHGGIGFTWEHPLHVWLKRGATFASRYGLRRQLDAELGAQLLARVKREGRRRPPRPHI